MKNFIYGGLVATCLSLTNNVAAQCSSTPNYTESYTTGWTSVDQTDHQTSSYFEISGNAFRYGNANNSVMYCGREQRAYKSIPQVNDRFWVAESKFTVGYGNAASALIMSLTAGTQDTWYSQTGNLTECTAWAGTATNQDAIFALLNSPFPSMFGDPVENGTWYICAGYKDGTSANNAASTGIPVTAMGDYYVRLQRTDYGTGVISVFSDPQMQTHVQGSPQCFDITHGTTLQGLNTLQHGTATMGGCIREFSGAVSNFKLYNGQSPCPLALNPVISSPTTFCGNLPVTVSGASSTSGTSVAIADHVWILTECNINGVNVPGTEVWGPFITGAPTGTYTFPASIIQCGKYYNVTLALQNCGNIWASTIKKIYVACPPVADAGPDIITCTNGCVTLSTTSTGKGKTLSWATMVGGLPTAIANTATVTVCPPPAPTDYTLTVTNINGCSASDVVTVNTNGIDPSFTISTSIASNPSYFNVSAMPNVLNANALPGFQQVYFVEEVVPIGPGPNTYSTVPGTQTGLTNLPPCWSTFPGPNVFSGYQSGSTTVTCGSPASGQFLVGRYYRIGRGTQSQNCDKKQITYIVASTGVQRLLNPTVTPDEISNSETSSAMNAELEGMNAHVSVFPNPTTGILKIESTNNVKSLRITSITGALIKEMESTNEVDLTNYPSGMYFFTVITENGQKIIKVIKE